MQVGILESNDFSIEVIEQLSKLGNVEYFDGKDINSFVENKDILFIRLKYFIGETLLKHAKKIKFICTPTTGLNHIDIDKCNERDIKILSLKGEYEFLTSIRATPEHTFGLVLSLLRNYKKSFLNKHNRAWNRELYKGFELYEKRVGIIGYGRVGKIISNYFLAFGCKVSFYDIEDIPFPEQINKQDSIESLIENSDIVLLTASYSKENESFFDKKYIDLLKNKYFINTARGELVEESYLIEKIKEDFFAGVALDVIKSETKEDNALSELLNVPQDINLLVSPHIAGATYESMWKTEKFILSKLLVTMKKDKI